MTKGIEIKNPENSGFSWWLLLAGTAGFAILSLLGAGVLVLLLGLG